MDEHLTLSQAAALCPGRPSAGALWRWARKGLKARDGTIVRLSHKRVGRHVFITQGDLDAFFAAVTAADLLFFEGSTNELGVAHKPPHPHQSPTARAKAIAAADARVRAAGV